MVSHDSLARIAVTRFGGAQEVPLTDVDFGAHSAPLDLTLLRSLPTRIRGFHGCSVSVATDVRLRCLDHAARDIDKKEMAAEHAVAEERRTRKLLLGAERTAGAQVLKQADVLMLHHLLPDEVASGSLFANLDYYEPRTAHGSSLSPAIHAGLFARAGRYPAALEWLRMAARIDLDDLTASTAGGLHLATMGGLWQALVFGFAGVRPRRDHLVVDPRLAPGWHALELSLRFHDHPLRLRIDHDGVSAVPESWRVQQTDTNWEVRPG